ncbi:hypothetical protein BJ742DRAFT_771239 [Cladochytrium replicatum]|nr:hypothetical protein BJ742DRAFT_771239 [Cladochytrium replicatum]
MKVVEREFDGIQVQVIELDNSYFVWVGACPPNESGPTGKLENLAVAMPTKYAPTATGTTLLAKGVDTDAELIAKRLSTKLKKMIYLSLDVGSQDLLVLAQRKVGDVLKELESGSTSTGQK